MVEGSLSKIIDVRGSGKNVEYLVDWNPSWISKQEIGTAAVAHVISVNL